MFDFAVTIHLTLTHICTPRKSIMTDTQFSDILARAGNIDEQFKIAPPHTQEEKDDFCDWIVAYVDSLRRKDRDSDAQKQIVLLELYACVSLVLDDATDRLTI